MDDPPNRQRNTAASRSRRANNRAVDPCFVFGKGFYAQPPVNGVLPYDYETFKKECHEIVRSGAIDQRILTYFIVSYTLQSWLALGDTTSIDEKIAITKGQLPLIKKSLEGARPKTEDLFFMDYYYKKPEKTDIAQEDRTFANTVLGVYQELFIDNLHERIKGNYCFYEYFCLEVVRELLLESYLYQ